MTDKEVSLNTEIKHSPPVFYSDSGFVYQVKTQAEIFNTISQFVSGQKKVLNQLSYIAHLYSMKLYHYYMGADMSTLPKVNTLLTAPTGCGKTHSVKSLAKALDLVYHRIDCSSISAEGWKGTSLSSFLKEYLEKTKSGYGIIHLDEFDKLAEGGLQGSTSAKQFTFERQGAFLDLLDGSYSFLYESRSGLITDLSACNNALIIVSGSFQTFRQEQEIVKQPIGFNREPDEFKKTVKNWRKELKEHGFMPELANRIMSNAEFEPYSRDEIKEILINTKNNPYEKFKNLLGDERAEISPEVLDRIVDEVLASETGMRELDALIFNEVYNNECS